SSGIGAEIARALARRGHGVTLVARRAELLDQLAIELTAGGVRADVIAVDLADRSARAGLLDRIHDLGLTPAVLVNNAGLSTLGPIAKADPESEMRMIEVDVVAVVDLCTRFLPAMVERRQGAILNVASTAAFQPLPGQAGYGACKSFRALVHVQPCWRATRVRCDSHRSLPWTGRHRLR
ncbi:MAG TPA: SDR family NAD(P)-dependent oxidoreductase, partial [Streptosporangiaceae bacterium]|nr:SDR family NAD(P)-dependent oxidoreductase [Streptosporangiaceae bacterium]